MALERSRALKEKWRSGETTFGAWLTLADTEAAEIMAEVGYDWIFIDMEHSSLDLIPLQRILTAFNRLPTVPIVRVPWNDPIRIKHVLDAGAEGIVCPMVRTVEEAERLVAATQYPPHGTRGYGPRRATNYYLTMVEYAEAAREGIIVIPQIEDIATDVDAIVKVPGIDAICVGPVDMSASAGRLMDIASPEMDAHYKRVLNSAAKAGLPTCAGVTLPPERTAEWHALGTRLVLTAMDVGLLAGGARSSLRAFQGLLGKK